jgi:hypothetical protein
MKKYLFLIFIFASSISLAQSTPQKYCESLAASSCEVLNTEYTTGGAATVYLYATIKYCRNRVFKSIIWNVTLNSVWPQADPTGSYNVSFQGHSTLTRYWGYNDGYSSYNTYTRVNSEMSNTALCSSGTILP